MTLQPVVVIPPRSPQLEAIALAVLWGAADESGTVPLPLIVGDPTGSLPPAADAPVVFLGWRADLEESRRLAEQTLAALTNPPSPPRQVVTFEVATRGSPAGSAAPLSDAPSAEASMRPRAPERFVVERGPGGDSPGLLELVRARRWGAETFAQWRSSPRAQPSESRTEDAAPTSSRTAPWCGIGE